MSGAASATRASRWCWRLRRRLGALAGGITAVLLSPNFLEGLLRLVLIYVVYSMRRLPKEEHVTAPTGLLDTSYTDSATGATVSYGVRNLPLGMGASFLAGNVSGLLGIGGGIIKVPIMTLVMGMPLRAAIGTSNFMIGVTAATSAVIYYQRGLLDPNIAIPTALGVLVGAQIGTRIGGKVRSTNLKLIFQGLLLLFAVQMLYQGGDGMSTERDRMSNTVDAGGASSPAACRPRRRPILVQSSAVARQGQRPRTWNAARSWSSPYHHDRHAAHAQHHQLHLHRPSAASMSRPISAIC